MDPKTQTPNLAPTPTPVNPAPPGQPETVNSPSGNSNTLKYIVLGLFVVTIFVLVLGVGYYFLVGNKTAYNSNNQMASYLSPTVTPTPSPITAVYNSADLTNLMNELSREDNSLNSELSSLSKDSNF